MREVRTRRGMMRGFLPVNHDEMRALGWEQPDFLYVSGDAYVDHPSFGHAIISRVLESKGFKVAMLPQPDWADAGTFLEFGAPRLGILVTAGVVDSMVNHYTASKKIRNQDSYSPGGKAGLRPDRAIITYCNRLRSVFKNLPIIIGGVEAGLRRFAHYDYWDNKVRRSVLVDSAADILVFGMGESAICAVADRLNSGERAFEIKNVRGTMYIERDGTGAALSRHADCVVLPSYYEVASDKKAYAEAFMAIDGEQDPVRGRPLCQDQGGGMLVVQNLPSEPLATGELDRVYSLLYQRSWHPMYDKDGGVPALEEVKFSITSHRGCFGGCSFCAINLHQGRMVQKRSEKSILREVETIKYDPGFKGYIHDVGGPSANFRNPSCKGQRKRGVCRDKQCLYPTPCKNLETGHGEYLELLRKIGEAEGIKKVFVRSGLRFDYILLDGDDVFLTELCRSHVSGQLKVAPEHVSPGVLRCMGKPGKEAYEAFSAKFDRINKALGKKQFLVPYLISGHPGCGLKDAVMLAEYMRDKRFSPEQVQDFYPTPGTLSTCMYCTGLDPRTMKRVHVPDWEEKAMQRALLQYRKPENKDKAIKALMKAGRGDLIGYGPKCLVRPSAKRHDGPGVKRYDRLGVKRHEPQRTVGLSAKRREPQHLVGPSAKRRKKPGAKPHSRKPG